MKLNPFSKRKKKKNDAERGHREPIVVKFFKEKDPDRSLHVILMRMQRRRIPGRRLP